MDPEDWGGEEKIAIFPTLVLHPNMFTWHESDASVIVLERKDETWEQWVCLLDLWKVRQTRPTLVLVWTNDPTEGEKITDTTCDRYGFHWGDSLLEISTDYPDFYSSVGQRSMASRKCLLFWKAENMIEEDFPGIRRQSSADVILTVSPPLTMLLMCGPGT